MSRIRIPNFLIPFLIFSLVLIVPTFVYLSIHTPSTPENDATTMVASNKLFAVGDEVGGGVIMQKLANETAKSVQTLITLLARERLM